MKPPLTAARFDKTMEMAPSSLRFSLASESLWGASAIAKFMGVSDDFVRKCARLGSSPIRQKAGRYYCTKTEITIWLLSNADHI